MVGDLWACLSWRVPLPVHHTAEGQQPVGAGCIGAVFLFPLLRPAVVRGSQTRPGARRQPVVTCLTPAGTGSAVGRAAGGV